MEDYYFLQSKINGITQDYQPILNYILSTNYIKTDEGINYIAHEIFQTSQIRPKYCKELALLVSDLIDNADSENKLSKLRKVILDQVSIFTQVKEKVGILYSIAKFLRNLLTLDVIKKEEIEQLIPKIKIPRFVDVIYDVFIPELGNHKTKYTAWPKSIIKDVWDSESITQFNEYLNKGGDESSIFAAIRSDITAPFMVDRFNYRRSVYSEELFDSKPIVNVAARYGSVNCFNRIVSMLSQYDDHLAEDAVIGGNLDIVKFCEEKNLNCSKHISLAIEYHNADVYEYLSQKNQEFSSPTSIGLELSTNFMYLLKKKQEAEIVDQYHFSQSVVLCHAFAAAFASQRSKELFTQHNVLTAAVVNGIPEVVAAFIDADPKFAKRFQNSDSDLYTAVINNRDSVVLTLLKYPVDVNQCCPAHYLAKEGKLDLLKKFFEREDFQPNLKNKEGLTLINCAVLSKKMEVVEYVFEKCPEVNVKDTLGLTPFHCAISISHLIIADYFLKKGANFNEPDSTGRTPLHTAAANGDINAVEYLLKIDGININAQTQHKRTPLHDAIKKGNIEVIKAIAQYPGLDPNIKDDTDRTPLHEAVLGGRLASAEVILNIPNVDKNIKCKGKTAFKLANTKEMRSLVLEKGGHK